MNNNMFLAKSKQINLCGVIGMALALLGLLLPGMRVSYMGMGASATLFEATWWTVFPLLLILGTCALYAMKYEVLGFLGSIVSAFIYFVVLLICRAVASGDAGSFGVKIHFSIGFYLAFLGFAIAIAAPWINDLIFKPQAKQPKADDPAGGPGMNRDLQQDMYGKAPQANPYMNQQPQVNPYMNQQPPVNPYMNQQPPVNPYMNQQPPVNPYMNQQPPVNPYMNQQPQAEPYVDQAQNLAGQAAKDAGQTLDQAGQFVQDAASELNKDQQ